MQDMPIDELLKKTGSIFKLVLLASQRTLELSDDAARLVDASASDKPSDIALKEILEGKISYKVKEKK